MPASEHRGGQCPPPKRVPMATRPRWAADRHRAAAPGDAQALPLPAGPPSDGLVVHRDRRRGGPEGPVARPQPTDRLRCDGPGLVPVEPVPPNQLHVPATRASGARSGFTSACAIGARLSDLASAESARTAVMARASASDAAAIARSPFTKPVTALIPVTRQFSFPRRSSLTCVATGWVSTGLPSPTAAMAGGFHPATHAGCPKLVRLLLAVGAPPAVTEDDCRDAHRRRPNRPALRERSWRIVGGTSRSRSLGTTASNRRRRKAHGRGAPRQCVPA